MRILSFICACLIASVSPASQSRAQARVSSPSVALVTRLYADFACAAVIDTPSCDSQHDLIDQPGTVLARYFDPPLVRLWVADRACVARTHEICNLDFRPIWASQDPVGTHVSITAGDDSSQVSVEVRHPFYREPRTLQYTLVKTPAGWRIHDIALGSEWSLVALLSRK